MSDYIFLVEDRNALDDATSDSDAGDEEEDY
jgi:hypothetical protein